jgi:hypothetical protein
MAPFRFIGAPRTIGLNRITFKINSIGIPDKSEYFCMNVSMMGSMVMI